jgi:hypothetical protein
LPDALAAQAEEAEEKEKEEPLIAAEVGTAEAEEAPRSPERRIRAAARGSRVPEYLRRGVGLSRRGKALVVAGFLVLIAIAVLLMNGPGDNNSLLGRLLAWRQSGEVEGTGSDVSGPSQNAAPTAAPGEGAEAGSTSEPLNPAEPSGESAQPVFAPAADGKATQAGKSAPPSGPLAKPSRAEERTSPKEPQAEQGVASGPKPQPPTGTTPAESGAVPDAVGAEPGKSVGSKVGPRPGRSSGEQVGRVVSAKQLLLRLNAKTGVWQRLADETIVNGDDQLIGLPAFRPRMALGGRVSLELVDATSLALLAPVEKGPHGIAVEFGWILAKAEDAAGASLRVVAGDHSGVCQFADANSVVAIEVSRAEGGGGDPETQPGPLVTDLYVTSGKVLWRDERGGKEIKLSAPVRLSVSEQPLEAVALQQMPRWVSGEAASPLDQRAASVLEREVMLGRPVWQALRELTAHRQREVRWLAMRSLSLVEDYQKLLDALADSDQYRFWGDHIDQLRWAVFRGPQSAAKVRTAMEQQYGPQGVALYEMLWKYRPDTLQPEDVNHLVNFLGHDVLPFRILSFWNLKNLYHNRTLYYRPDDTAIKRQPAIQKWRELLKVSPTPRTGAPPQPEPPPRGSPGAGIPSDGDSK